MYWSPAGKDSYTEAGTCADYTSANGLGVVFLFRHYPRRQSQEPRQRRGSSRTAAVDPVEI